MSSEKKARRTSITEEIKTVQKPTTSFLKNQIKLLGGKNYSKLKKHELQEMHDKLKGDGLKDLFTGIKREYNNVSKKTLKEYGDLNIENITIIRTPFFTALKSVLKAITSYDKLYHLCMAVQVKEGNITKNISIEKQQQVNVKAKVEMDKNSETINVPLNKQLTMNKMLQSALDKNGPDKFFLYSATTNNCQDFLMMLLESNGIGNKADKDFIKQDVEHLQGNTLLNKGLNALTDLGAKAAEVVGSGANEDYLKRKETGIRTGPQAPVKYINERGVKMWEAKQAKIKKQNEEFKQRQKEIHEEISAKQREENKEYLEGQQSKRKKNKMLIEKMTEYLMENYGWNGVKPPMNTFIKNVEEEHDVYIDQNQETGEVEAKPIHENA